MGVGLFTDEVLDHFTNPRNVGALEHPDAIGTVGDPVCGDCLELHLEVRNNIITDVRFKVRGCVAAMIKVNAPLLTDCAVNIECTVVDSILTGSHEMFVGRVEIVHADPLLVQEDGTIDFAKLSLL